MEKYKRATRIGEPEASALEMHVVARVDTGPLARLFDDYEKQGLISTHIDLEVCQSNIPPYFEDAYPLFIALG